MENKLPPISKELAAIINQEAADYSAVQYGDPAKMQGLREIAAFDNGVEDYTAGATAYAHYKERFEHAMNALEQIANAPTPYNLEEMWSWIHTARNLSDTALASWKEGQAEKQPESEYSKEHILADRRFQIWADKHLFWKGGCYEAKRGNDRYSQQEAYRQYLKMNPPAKPEDTNKTE